MLGMQPSAHRSGAPVAVTRDDGGGTELVTTYKAWQGNNVFFLGGRLIFGPDAQSILLSIFLVTVPVTIFCIFVARKLMDDFPQNRGISIPVIGVGLTLLDLIFLLLTSGRDPGIIPRSLYPPEPEGNEGNSDPQLSRTPPLQLRRTKDMVINGITVKIKYCDTCMLYRPPRASHCSICNNCVDKFDHHCPWLGQCIGLRNYRFYFMFVLCSTLLCIYVHVFCWIYIRRIMDGEKTTIWKALIKTPASIALIIYTFISVWFVGGLTGFHLYLISTNQSTYENFRYRYGKHENPFNKGIIKNFTQVFCWSIPQSQNKFRAKIPKDPVIPQRRVNGGIASPSMEKVVQDIEMGRKPVWTETVEEELGSLDKNEEAAVVSRDLSRMLPLEETEGREIRHSRGSSRRQRGENWEVSNRFSGDFPLEGSQDWPRRRAESESESESDEKGTERGSRNSRRNGRL